MSAAAVALIAILGTWQYAGFCYGGDFYPKPNPNLILKFSFYPEGTSHLVWYRTNEPGFCERRAESKLEDDILYQKVIWLNPANDRSCSQDPDMQMGHETRTPIQVSKEELAFVLDLDGREFLYLLRRVQSVSAP